MSTWKRARTLDMTEGRPIGLILIYAVPLLLGTLFQQLYNVVDTMIAGTFLGGEAVAAIGSTAMLYQMVLGIALGLNNGCAIVLARLFGMGNRRKFALGVSAMFVLVMGMSIMFTAVTLCSVSGVLRMLDTPEDIFVDARNYIRIIYGGLLLTGAYNMSAGFLRAVGNSRTPLYILILSSVLNVVLDVLLVVVFHLGVVGTALATISAQGISAFICIVYILKEYKEYLPSKAEFRPERSIVREMFLTGMSMAVMEGIYAMGSVVLQRAINGLGTAVITAHTSARRIIDLLKAPLGTLGNAAAFFAGQNYGAGKMERVHTAVKDAIVLSGVWCVISLLFSYFCSRWLLILLAGGYEESILQNAQFYLRVSSLFLFPLALLFVLRFTMQATSHKIVPIFSSLIELVVKIISALWVVDRYGYKGAAATEPIIWFICGVFLLIIYIGQRRKESARGIFVKTVKERIV